MVDALIQQLSEFMEPQEARQHVALVRMAGALISATTEAEGLKARVAELEAATAEA